MTLRFVYGHQDLLSDVERRGNAPTATPTAFDRTIRGEWSDRMRRGLLRYPLGRLETRVLPGRCGFVAQLNVQRGVERRRPQEILSIQQEFNPRQFNFNQINPEEVLCEMMKDTDSAPTRMLVLVNVSPLEFGHCLFVPDPSRCFPQILTRFSIRVGIESVLLSSDPAFRVGFNSLGGFASVNHLHLHGYYLHQELQLESAPAQPLVPHKAFHRLHFPAGFLFYVEPQEVEEVQEVAAAVCLVTDFLVKENIAHNLFLTRGCPPSAPSCSRKGVRIAIWPRASCFGTKEEAAINVALCELAGHLPFKSREEYERSTEEEVQALIHRSLLPEEELHRLEEQLTEQLQAS